MRERSWTEYLAALVLLVGAAAVILWVYLETGRQTAAADADRQTFEARAQSVQVEAADRVARECAFPRTT